MLAELWELEKDKDIYRYDNLKYLESRTSEMTRILKFDETVKEITSETIFTGLYLDYGDTDFKKLFIQHFLNREIKWQTLELFQSNVCHFISRFKKCWINNFLKSVKWQTLDKNNSNVCHFISRFKKCWINNFLNREIKWQTLELFQSKIAATFLMN